MLSYSEYNEQELVALFQEGVEEAFVEVYRRHWQQLYNAAYKRLQDEAQCKDLVQNVFTDLWERRNEVKIGNLSAYLHTAVRFQVIKTATRHPATSRFAEPIENRLVSGAGADDELIESELLDLARLWIEALPEKRREIFLMYYSDELSSARIAQLLGISQKTVQNQLTTAVNTLRNRLSHLLVACIAVPFWAAKG